MINPSFARIHMQAFFDVIWSDLVVVQRRDMTVEARKNLMIPLLTAFDLVTRGDEITMHTLQSQTGRTNAVLYKEFVILTELGYVEARTRARSSGPSKENVYAFTPKFVTRVLAAHDRTPSAPAVPGRAGSSLKLVKR